MTERNIHRVTVRHNVVFGIQRLAESGGIEVPETKLEVGTQRARKPPCRRQIPIDRTGRTAAPDPPAVASY